MTRGIAAQLDTRRNGAFAVAGLPAPFVPLAKRRENPRDSADPVRHVTTRDFSGAFISARDSLFAMCAVLDFVRFV